MAANKDSSCNENLKVTLTIASSLTHQLSKNTDPRKSNSLNDEHIKKNNSATTQKSYMKTIVKNSMKTHPKKNTHKKNGDIDSIINLKIYQ